VPKKSVQFKDELKPEAPRKAPAPAIGSKVLAQQPNQRKDDFEDDLPEGSESNL